MLNLKEKIKYRNILRRSITQNFEKAKYNMENFSENDNFHKLLAIQMVTGEKYSKRGYFEYITQARKRQCQRN